MMRLLATILSTVLLLSCSGSDLSRPDASRAGADWVEKTLRSLTLEEKVGQLIMPKVYSHYFSSESDQYKQVEHYVRNAKVGGLVLFQGDVYEQAVLLNNMQTLAKVPLLVAADYERGTAMRTRKGTYFPDAMAIGATRNTRHAYDVGKAIAEEARAIGVHQNYAPVADVNNNPENPVINTRAFGDSPELVAGMASAMARGMNEGGILSTAKHFPGHGDTDVDSHLSLPLLPYDRSRLDSMELLPFRATVEAGVRSMMIGHLAVPALDSSAGVPATLSHPIITDVLQGQLKFSGLIVTDAMDMMGVVRGFSNAEASVRTIQSGVDVILLPHDVDGAIAAIVEAVHSGELSMERIDASVRKVLMAKQSLGLDRTKLVDLNGVGAHVATPEHLSLARSVARDAITVLRNEGNILPLLPKQGRKVVSILLSDRDEAWSEVHRPSNPWPVERTGEYFARMMVQRIGPYATIRLSPASNAVEVDSAIAEMQRADLVLVPLHVKVRTHSGRIGIPGNLQKMVDALNRSAKPTVVIAFGSPYNVAAFPKATALVCSYSDAEPLTEATVEAITGSIPWRGTLPIEIRHLYPFGSGIIAAQTTLREDKPEVAGFRSSALTKIDSILNASIRDSIFPAAQVLIAKDGIIACKKSFGRFTYDRSAREINDNSLFDLASLTKVIATTSAVMKLYDEGKLKLEDNVGKFVPQFSEGRKAEITIYHLLTHSSGLPPFRQLWKICPDPQYALDTVYLTPLVANPGDTTIYSDLGFITLGKIVEKVSGKPLDVYVRDTFFEPLGMFRTMYRPFDERRMGNIVPTEYDSLWRKKLVRGRVHDENAEFLGGVSGHAGLFSTAEDLSIMMQMLMNGGTYGGVRFLSETTVQAFTQRQRDASSRALGWDTKSEKGSSAGHYFSPNSFGHTGFTGTSIWADPQRKLFLILLTNRVYPTRANSRIFGVRAATADAAIQALVP